MENAGNNQAVIDKFHQFSYLDKDTGIKLEYNLFIPENYDPECTYPLVIFIHDLGVVSDDVKSTLRECYGSVIWAMPEEQAKHACFVLAPQYSRKIVNDASEATEELDITVSLIRSLISKYPINEKRVYTTGQSMGCMSSIEMMIRYPDLFAAGLLVAGQWDADRMADLKLAKMWIVVSEGDRKAFPGMNASMAALEAKGAKISKAKWDGQSSPEEFSIEVKKLISEGNPVKYVALKQGTVVPEGLEDNGLNNHMNTWPIVYRIEALRDWLFTEQRL